MNKKRQLSLRNVVATSLDQARVASARRMLVETLEDRRLMTQAPWGHTALTLPMDAFDSLESPAPLVAEGEGELVSVRMAVKNSDGTSLNPAAVQLGQAFQLIVSAQDLRSQPQGVFALFNDIHIAQADNIELLVGETQLIEISPNVTGGTFTLQFNAATATVSIPSDYRGTDPNTFGVLSGRIQSALDGALGSNKAAVTVELSTTTPRFLVNFRGDMLGENAPAMVGNFSGLSTSSGNASGSVIDDFVPADPNNLSAFRNSAVAFFPQGVRPSGKFNTNQPEVIASAGSVRGLGLPTDPAAETAFYGIHFRATSTGTTTFTSSPGMDRPGDDILMYPVVVVEPSMVDFQSLDITIVDTTDPAIDLGTISGPFALDNQSIATSGSEKLYKFTTAGTGLSIHRVAIEFTHEAGDLDIELQDADHHVIGSSTGVASVEQISLNGRSADTYYVRVFGFANATNSFRLTISAPIASIAPDSFESNNQWTSATNLGSVEGVREVGRPSIHNSDDVDYFKFTTSAVGGMDDSVRILFSHARGDLDMRLLNSEGVVISSSNSTQDFEEISLKGLAAGTYYVHVLGFNGATNPAYGLRLRTPQSVVPADAFEPNNSREQATQLVVPNGQITSLTINSTTDQDWYRFNLPTKPTLGHKVSIAFSHAVADLDIELYSNSGTLLRRSSGVGDDETILLSGLDAGDYYLKVFSYLNVPSPAYSLSLSIPGASIAPDRMESNETLATASNLRRIDGVLELLELSIHNSNDVDWFRLETSGKSTSSHFAGLVFNGSMGDIDMELYNEQGFQIAQSFSTQDTEYVSLNGLDAGTYFIKVRGYNGATNPRYSLSIKAPELNIALDQYEPNNDEVAATQLRTLTGTRTLTDLSIHEPGDADWFQFETVASGTAQHNIVVNFEHTLGDVDVFLLAANGDIVGSSTGVGNREIISLANLPAGTYRLQVLGFLNATNPSYDVTFTAPTEDSIVDRLEANDSRATATDLRGVSGELTLQDLSIHAASDRDWFQLETIASSSDAHGLRLEFVHRVGDIDVKLYDSAGALLRSSQSTGNEESISFGGLPAGTYFVEVYGYGVAINPNYSISFHSPTGASQILPDRFESNDTLETASLLRTSGDNLTGSLNVNDLTVNTEVDLDYYQFNTVGTGTAAHSVTLTYAPGGAPLHLEVLNSSGQVVGSSNSESGSETVSLSGLNAGRYYLKITGSYINALNRYDLRIDAPTETADGQLDAWTIMVYMTASDLAEFAFQDINEIEQAVAGLPGSVNIAVLWDQSADLESYATDSGSQAAWDTLGRAFIEPDTNPNSIATRFELLPEASTGDPDTLASFMRWAASNAPAENYALIGWDHGAGIFGSNFDSADGGNFDFLEVSEWHDALSQPDVPPIALLSFDACLMAMAEVQYALRDVTELFVGSQEVVSGDGYDYRTLFQALATQPYAVGVEALGSGFVQSYQDMTAGQGGDWDTQSAVRSSTIVDLAAAIRTFTDATLALSTAQLSTIAQAIEASISYSDPEFRDLGSIMLGVLSSSLPTTVRDAAEGVLNAINSSLVLKASDGRQSSGVSIFAPESGSVGSTYNDEYADFVSATGWASMLARVGTISSGRVTSGGRFGAFASTRDWAESNNIAADATNLYQLSGSGVMLNNLSLHDANDLDWYRFSIGATGAAGHVITVDGGPTTMKLELYDASSASLLESSESVQPTVSLSGMAAGTYTIRVSASSAVRSYHIVSSAPTATGRSRTGDNSSPDKAYPLGLVGNQLTLPSLQIQAGSTSWFSVDTPRLPGPQWYSVTIDSATNANLVVQILDASGQVVSQDSGAGTLTVGYRASGASESYRLKVTNAASAAAVYNLAIDTLLGTITDISVHERLIGVSIDALPLTELVHQVGTVTVDDSRFEWAGNELRLRAGQVLAQTAASQLFVPITVTDASQVGSSVSFILPLLIESNPFAFHNSESALNVNDDINPRTGLAAVTALDALLIINDINTLGSRPLTNRNASSSGADPFLDTSRDGFLSAIDALLVINYLNTNPSGEGESSSSATTALQPEYITTVAATGAGSMWSVPESRVRRRAVDSVFGDWQ